MRVQTAILLVALIGAAYAEEAKKESADAKDKSKRGLFDIGLGHDFGGFDHGLGSVSVGSAGLSSLGHDEGHISGITIHREVKVPVPAPYTVEKHVPVPYPVHVKVPVDRPVPYHVPAPYPVPVEKTIHVPVEKPVPYPVKVPVKVLVEEPYPVHVPVKVPVPVEKAVPYPVKVPVVVKESVPVFVHDHHHGHGDHYGNDLFGHHL